MLCMANVCTSIGRFQLLRKKKCWILWLFPGAYQHKGEHSDGKYQRDLFVKGSHMKNGKYIRVRWVQKQYWKSTDITADRTKI